MYFVTYLGCEPVLLGLATFPPQNVFQLQQLNVGLCSFPKYWYAIIWNDCYLIVKAKTRGLMSHDVYLTFTYICNCINVFTLLKQCVNNRHVSFHCCGMDSSSSTLNVKIKKNNNYIVLYTKENLIKIHWSCTNYKLRTLFGINKGTPFLKRTIAVSGCPFKAAMCIKVLPSLVRSNTDALNLSARNSTVAVWPRSAAKCIGVRSINSKM